MKDSLDSWLEYIASVHPQEIELGLDRIRRVATRMQIHRPAPLVVTVAGTNGKGSCVACMESILIHAGYKVAAYTSPHLHRFNERVRLQGQAVNDEALCDALRLVEEHRSPDSLSYFEFSTLAALWIFQQSDSDVALLEVGLGGRLDAVNIVDADVALISSIALDHESWLGSDLESIGREKAGILRPEIPAVFGASTPPLSITKLAAELGAPLSVLGQEFDFSRDDSLGVWAWHGSLSLKQIGQDTTRQDLEGIALPLPAIALSNAASSLQALSLLPLDLSLEVIRAGLEQLRLAGRFEQRRHRATGTAVIFDVAHNTAAAELLATNLLRLQREKPWIERITLVLAVMADKHIESMALALKSCVDNWYIAQVDEPRCMPADEAEKRVATAIELGDGREIAGCIPGTTSGTARIQCFESVHAAFDAACQRASTGELIVVSGSFFTVAAVRELSDPL